MHPSKTPLTISNNILVVEDSRIIQNMIKKALSLTNYNAESVTDGQKALACIHAKKEVYKAIFLDLLMPHMNGVETIREIRKLPDEKADVIVIAVTGNHNQFSAADFKKLGFNAVVIKPVDCDILVNLLERLSDPEADRWLGVIAPTGRVEL